MLEILYRDDCLIAIHKPAGLLVHRSPIAAREERFAVQLLRDQIGRRVHPAHRLDRGTSGVLLFALDRDTAASLGALFETRRVKKRYLAIVRGHPASEGTIDHPLVRPVDPAARPRHAPRRPRASVAEEDEDPELIAEAEQGAAPAAQSALTRFRRLAIAELPYRVDRYPSSRYALLELEPETGRRHQIRRHLKHLSHPIIGDATYGKGRHNRLFQTLFASQRLLLACTRLAFVHPVSGEPLGIDAPPAADFIAVTRALGWADETATGITTAA
ncbi:MAG: pseudouridylate synthase [Thauera phenolivorans]|uniref:tRNA pseudouridine synthase C n=1 Tax=Thauera phenolivorans TaxID=1792543 RepID=A0A7X7R790_9RHOO|nr:pseudouridylate synthase [Thauera phenolivorans]